MKRRHLLTLPFLLPVLSGFNRAAASINYAVVQPGLPLIFPRDHGAHPDYRTEWWYVTGAVDTPIVGTEFLAEAWHSELPAPVFQPGDTDVY